LWDASGQLLQTFNFGKDVGDQQLGCLSVGDELLSINLLGSITYLDHQNPDHPKRVLLGHNKIITALAYDPASDRIYTADFGGYIIEWNPTDGSTKGFTGSPHASQVQQLKISNGNLISVSVDDTLKITPLHNREFPEGIALGSQPSSVDARGDTIVVSCIGNIVVVNKGSIVNKHAINYVPSSIAISPDGTHVAVGGKDNKIHVYHLDAGKLKDAHVLEDHRGEVTALSYSPDGRYLGSGDANREVMVWEGQKSVVNGWVYHTSRVQDLSWSNDSNHLVTGSVDSALIVWTVNEPNKRVMIKLAHVGGVRGVTFSSNNTVLSVGQDCALKQWQINY